MIKGAPFSFAIVVLISWVLGWFAIQWYYSENLSRKNDLIQTLRQQIEAQPSKETASKTPGVQRPEFLISKETEVLREVVYYKDAKDKGTQGEIRVNFKLCFRNTGSLSAHDLKIRVGWTPVENVEKFKKITYKSISNRVPSQAPYPICVRMQFIQEFSVDEQGIKAIASKGLSLYAGLEYGDSPKGERRYEEDYWLRYLFIDGDLVSASTAEKEALEPYVRAAYAD